jgi:hypothetical protein
VDAQEERDGREGERSSPSLDDLLGAIRGS